MLTILDTLPERLLTAGPMELAEFLPGPTLIHLPGRQQPALFVSVLLHGHEYTGLQAMQTILRKYRDQLPPRALSLFIGNVAAAQAGVRQLDYQADYNRIWLAEGDKPEHFMIRLILDDMHQRGVFASIDMHNNTGLNPYYACVNRLEQPFLYLATLFNRTVVYFTHPRGTQAAAFAELCPAVTLECGKPGNPGSAEQAANFIDACLHLSHFPEHPVPQQDIDLFHTVAIVKVPQHIQFSFDEEDADIQFDSRLDHLNFRELPAGTWLGRVRTGMTLPLHVWNNKDQEVGKEFFTIEDAELLTSRPVMPSMLTLDKRVIRQDCLCYLMERISYPIVSDSD